LLCILIVFNTAGAGQYQTPIVLKSSTTFQPESEHFEIRPNADIPVDFIVEIIPTGGTVRVRFDGDLVASWNDEEVSAGESFDLGVTFTANESSVGEVWVEYGYLIRPSFGIHFDAIFHDPTQHWGELDPSLRDYPFEGDREGGFPLEDDVPESIIEHYMPISPDHSLFLLDDAFQFDTFSEVPLSFTCEPYPCLELSVLATVRTELYFSLETDDVCIQYASGEDDTLCWDAEESDLDCYDYLPLPPYPWPYTVEIPCEEVADYVVPLCPVKANSAAHVRVLAKVLLHELRLRYTCLDSQVGDISDVTQSEAGLTLFEDDLFLGSDRDDAIFTVPVMLADIEVSVLDAQGSTLEAYDEVHAGDSYTIAWTPLDDALMTCCRAQGVNERVKITYRDRDAALPPECCSGTIKPNLEPGDNRSYPWPVPNINCLENGELFRVSIEYYCPAGDEILYRAWTEWFTYRKPMGGEQR
jgi:hypothetical protein